MGERLERLNQVFQDVFDDDELRITRQTTAKDVEGWDSLMHVTLIVNVEKAFRVKFSSSEVAALQNVGELIDLIDARSTADLISRALTLRPRSGSRPPPSTIDRHRPDSLLAPENLPHELPFRTLQADRPSCARRVESTRPSPCCATP